MSHRDLASLVGRWLENLAFLAGIGIAVRYGLAESDAVALCTAATRPIPWGLFAIIGVCLLPKMLGRETAGRVWGAVADRVAPRRTE